MIEYNKPSGPVEQVDKTWIQVAPVDMTGYTPGGTTTETTFAGAWEALQTYAAERLGESSKNLQVTCTIRRQLGDMAQLTVRTQNFVKEEDEEEEEDTGGDSGSSGTSAGTEISVEVAPELASILTHPKFKSTNWGSAEGIALKKLAAGADPDEIFSMNGQDYVVGVEAQKVQYWELVQQAAHFYVPHVLVTVTDTGASVSEETVGAIVSSVPGMSTPGGYNWLSLGGGLQERNGVKQRVRKFLLSGPGGWSKDIYNN